ncbi:MAG: E3 ubiquitin-protein transferase rmnd5a, variant 2 [Marteilia pararefringens]
MIADEEQILNKLEHPSSISIIKPPGIVAEIFGEVFLKHYDRISLKPLEACFKAGLLALPGIFDSLNNSDLPPEDYWNHQQNLSFDFNLPLQYTYHSRLVCPVLKTQSTSNNPPYALKCGHILSNDAINSMIGSSSNKDIKCPYCPVSSPKNSTLKLNIQ